MLVFVNVYICIGVRVHLNTLAEVAKRTGGPPSQGDSLRSQRAALDHYVYTRDSSQKRSRCFDIVHYRNLVIVYIHLVLVP